jgi:hypothetical protein
MIDVIYRRARRAWSAFALALLCFFCAIGVANAQQCMTSYYRAKSPACLTAIAQRILENYSSADDAMVGDAFRMGLMMSKFGPGLAPKGRNAVTAQAACAKYRCKEDQTKFLRVMTLATALWSLQSLSGQDDGIKKTLSGFFARDARLKNLFTIEQTAFGNYLTAMVVVATLKPDQTGVDRETYAAMDKSASIYESRGSAKDAFAPMMNLKK